MENEHFDEDMNWFEELMKIPELYKTENIPAKDKMIHEHFFLFECDWYIAEYDPKSDIFFGYVILNGDYQNAEWGYVDYSELRDLNIGGFEVSRDMDWYPKKAGYIEKIIDSGGVKY